MTIAEASFISKLSKLKDPSKFENLYMILSKTKLSLEEFKLLQGNPALTPLLIRLSGVYQEQIHLDMISKYASFENLDNQYAILEGLLNVKDLNWIMSLDIYNLIKPAAYSGHWFVLQSGAKLIAKLYSLLEKDFVDKLLLHLLNNPDFQLNGLEILLRISEVDQNSPFATASVSSTLLDIVSIKNDKIAVDKSFEIIILNIERGFKYGNGVLENALLKSDHSKLEIFQLICLDYDLSNEESLVKEACLVFEIVSQNFDQNLRSSRFSNLVATLEAVLNGLTLHRSDIIRRNVTIDAYLHLIKFCTTRLTNDLWTKTLVPICISYLESLSFSSKTQIATLLDALKCCCFDSKIDFLVSLLQSNKLNIVGRRNALELLISKAGTSNEKELLAEVIADGLKNSDWAIRDLTCSYMPKMLLRDSSLFWGSELPRLAIRLLLDKEVYVLKSVLGSLLQIVEYQKLSSGFISDLARHICQSMQSADSLVLADFIKVVNTPPLRPLITIDLFKGWLEHEQYDIRVEAVKICTSIISLKMSSTDCEIMLSMIQSLENDPSRLVKAEFITLISLGLEQDIFPNFKKYCSTLDLESLKLKSDPNELYTAEWYLDESALDDSRADDALNCYDCYDC